MDKESYAEIGKLLRSAREQLRLSADQASDMLHIRVRYLEALEEGRLEELPGLTYTRGYLQSYAVFLGLDKDEILRRFEEMEALLARKSFYFPQAFSREKTPSRWIVWGSLAVALMMYSLWSVLMQPSVPLISQVEKLPPAPLKPKVRISIDTMREVACLREADVLYPPCTMGKAPIFSLNPMHGPLGTIMDFPIIELVESDSDSDLDSEPESDSESESKPD